MPRHAVVDHSKQFVLILKAVRSRCSVKIFLIYSVTLMFETRVHFWQLYIRVVIRCMGSGMK